MFAIDARFDTLQPECMRDSFTGGEVSRLMDLLDSWEIVDDRWKLVPDATFARSLPVEHDDGTIGQITFLLMPQWIKIRWVNGELVLSKLYFIARTDIS